ncbi:MAG: glutamate--tRNA ligase [Defluviitaleaceae bacterium]|nr:glutamate--tRNA ligase [Defluviitaleaceae bacterium]
MLRTRFAPSPTGFMHIGNLRSALFGYLLARSSGGTFILRIEDTDQARYTDGAVDKIYETLAAAGIVCDEGPHIGGDFVPYVQSERKEKYLICAKELIDRGKAYYCVCPKAEEGEEIVCDCKNKDISTPEGSFVIRHRVPEGSTTFNDLVFGDITVENSEIEDMVLIKSDGMPTYNFANVVDDHFMEITHITRGSEFLASTPKHKLLYQAFGWDVPIYCHLPLILSPDGGKLSKRKGDAYFDDFVKKGFLPQALVNFIALLGFAPPNNPDNREIFTLDELIKVFDVKGLNKSPATFDLQKLKWMNGEYIKALPMDEFLALSAKHTGKPAVFAAMTKERIHTFDEIPAMLDFVDNLSDYDVSLFENKKNKIDTATAKETLAKLLSVIENLHVQDFTIEKLKQTLSDFATEHSLKTAQVLMPLRVALSGKETSPAGATELLAAFGKDESINRIKTALSKLLCRACSGF